MPDITFDSLALKLGDGTIDLDSHAFKVMLLADTYTPDPAHAVLADVSAHEISGVGYVAGGAPLPNPTWSRSGGTVTFSADEVTWPGATFTARYGVIYDDSAPNKDLLFLADFGANKTVSSATFTLQWNAAGVFRISKS